MGSADCGHQRFPKFGPEQLIANSYFFYSYAMADHQSPENNVWQEILKFRWPVKSRQHGVVDCSYPEFFEQWQLKDGT